MEVNTFFSKSSCLYWYNTGKTHQLTIPHSLGETIYSLKGNQGGRQLNEEVFADRFIFRSMITALR